jgi:hypothetical protein
MSDQTQPPPFNVDRRQPTPPATETPPLRDQFAMAALTGLLSALEYGNPADHIAQQAYAAADAMLEARKTKK